MNEELVAAGLSHLGKAPGRAQHAFLHLSLRACDADDVKLIANYPLLQDVDLDNNAITDTTALGALPDLRHLSLAHNKLHCFPAFAKPGPRALTELNLSGNSIAQLQANELAPHAYLRQLIVRDNRIPSLAAFNVCRHIEHLDVSGNTVEDIGALEAPDLTELLMDRNGVSSLRNLHASLRGLRTLSLSRNNLASLEGLQGLQALVKFDVSHNKVAELEELSVLAALRQLRELDLRGNPIERIQAYRDKVLYMLPALERLDGQPVSAADKVDAANKHGANRQFREAAMSHFLPDGPRTARKPDSAPLPAEARAAHAGALAEWLSLLRVASSACANDIDAERLARLEDFDFSGVYLGEVGMWAMCRVLCNIASSLRSVRLDGSLKPTEPCFAEQSAAPCEQKSVAAALNTLSRALECISAMTSSSQSGTADIAPAASAAQPASPSSASASESLARAAAAAAPVDTDEPRAEPQVVREAAPVPLVAGVSELSLGSCGLGDGAGVEYCARALRSLIESGGAGLRSLLLPHNRLGAHVHAESGIDSFVRLQTSPCLSELCGAPFRSLVRLDLSDNAIDDAGAALIASALRDEQCAVRVLNLSDNPIGEAGAQSLARALSVNDTLSRLEICGGPHGALNANSVCALVSAIAKQNDALTSLDVSNTPCGSCDCVESVCLMLRPLTRYRRRVAECRMEELRMANTGLCAGALSQLADALTLNARPELAALGAVDRASAPDIRVLDLSNNPGVDDASVARLLRGLAGHPSLEVCNLADAPIGPEAASAFVGLVKSRAVIQSIHLGSGRTDEPLTSGATEQRQEAADVKCTCAKCAARRVEVDEPQVSLSDAFISALSPADEKSGPVLADCTPALQRVSLSFAPRANQQTLSSDALACVVGALVGHDSNVLEFIELAYAPWNTESVKCLTALVQQRPELRGLSLQHGVWVGESGGESEREHAGVEPEPTQPGDAAPLAETVLRALAAEGCHVQHVDLSHVALGNAGAGSVARGVCACPSLVSLRLAHCALGANESGLGNGMRDLLVALTSNECPVRTLDLSFNELSRTALTGVAEMAARTHTLSQLRLDGNVVSSGDIACIGLLMSGCARSTIVSLGLPDVEMDQKAGLGAQQDATIATLANGLAECAQLRVLQLGASYCWPFSSKQKMMLCQALRANTETNLYFRVPPANIVPKQRDRPSSSKPSSSAAAQPNEAVNNEFASCLAFNRAALALGL